MMCITYNARLHNLLRVVSLTKLFRTPAECCSELCTDRYTVDDWPSISSDAAMDGLCG